MNTYIIGVDAALSAVQKVRQKDIGRAILAAPFVSRLPLLPQSPWPTVTMHPRRMSGDIQPHRIYDDLQTYDDIVKPIQEAVNTFWVCIHHLLF